MFWHVLTINRIIQDPTSGGLPWQLPGGLASGCLEVTEWRRSYAVPPPPIKAEIRVQHASTTPPVQPVGAGRQSIPSQVGGVLSPPWQHLPVVPCTTIADLRIPSTRTFQRISCLSRSLPDMWTGRSMPQMAGVKASLSQWIEKLGPPVMGQASNTIRIFWDP